MMPPCLTASGCQVDREALDEEVHNLDFLVDSARRICDLLAIGGMTGGGLRWMRNGG